MNRHPDPRRLAVGLFTLLVAVVVVAGWDGAGAAWLVPVALILGGVGLAVGRVDGPR